MAIPKKRLTQELSQLLSTFSVSELENIRIELEELSPRAFRTRQADLRETLTLLRVLNKSQLEWIRHLANQFILPHTYTIVTPGLISDEVLQHVGDALLVHHSMSAEPFSKDKTEYILHRSFVASKVKADLAPRGNPGHDITIGGKRFSLKTQADANIKDHELHISKFMELGKGDWSNNPAQLEALRTQFFDHMKSYDRILSFRNLRKAPRRWFYELVEIPKALLLEAKNGELQMMLDSPQNPKPGYCRVRNKRGELKYELYFDGGTERKLQIRHINKNLCTIHATWLLPAEDALL